MEDEQSLSLRLALKDIVDSAANIGLDKTKYHYAELLDFTKGDLQSPDRSIDMSMDSIFTDIAIARTFRIICNSLLTISALPL